MTERNGVAGKPFYPVAKAVFFTPVLFSIILRTLWWIHIEHSVLSPQSHKIAHWKMATGNHNDWAIVHSERLCPKWFPPFSYPIWVLTHHNGSLHLLRLRPILSFRSSSSNSTCFLPGNQCGPYKRAAMACFAFFSVPSWLSSRRYGALLCSHGLCWCTAFVRVGNLWAGNDTGRVAPVVFFWDAPTTTQNVEDVDKQEFYIF